MPNFIEVTMDAASKTALHFQGQAINGTLSPSIPEIIGINKAEGVAMKFLKDTLYGEVEELNPVLITSKGGAYSGCYGPVVCEKNGQVVISAGLKQSTLNLTQDKKIFYLEGTEVEADVVNTKVNGYDKPVLCLTWETEQFTLALNLPFKFKPLTEGATEPSIKQLKTMLGDLPSLAGLLQEPPKQPVDLFPAKYLNPGMYEVTGYQSWISKKTGRYTAYLLVEGAKDENGLLTQEIKSPSTPEQEKDLSTADTILLDKVGIFVPSFLINKIQQDPDLSVWKPATLVVNSVKPSKSGNGYSVDAGIIYHPHQTFRAIEDDSSDLSFLDLVI